MTGLSPVKSLFHTHETVCHKKICWMEQKSHTLQHKDWCWVGSCHLWCKGVRHTSMKFLWEVSSTPRPVQAQLAKCCIHHFSLLLLLPWSGNSNTKSIVIQLWMIAILSHSHSKWFQGVPSCYIKLKKVGMRSVSSWSCCLSVSLFSKSLFGILMWHGCNFCHSDWFENHISRQGNNIHYDLCPTR